MRGMKTSLIALFFLLVQAVPQGNNRPQKFSISKSVLQDKIKGGWAGQVIGSNLTIPDDFRSDSSLTDSSEVLSTLVRNLSTALSQNPTAFEDVYKDLFFVNVMEEEGISASADAFANALIHAPYPTSHASLTARYNLIHGVPPPASGHWRNNPNANCRDFQSQSDFIGLMSPGMPRAVSHLANTVGHVMNYGDGYYGGLYVANLYAHAMLKDDIQQIVELALKSIPERTEFYKAIDEIVQHHKQKPTDWEGILKKCQRRWEREDTCGLNYTRSIDSRRNAIQLTICLLFGSGDFGKSIAVSTAIKSDGSIYSQPTLLGVLGSLHGYQEMPSRWKAELETIEGRSLPYVKTTLSDAYALSFKHALQHISKNGGKIRNNEVLIAIQHSHAAKIERSFEGHYPVAQILPEAYVLDHEKEFDFRGLGFLVLGDSTVQTDTSNFVLDVAVYLNDKHVENVSLPIRSNERRPELFWRYQLAHGQYKLRIKPLNPSPEHPFNISKIIVYDVQHERCAMNQ